MTERNEREIYNFILEHIDSVPHLEALLLLWNSRPQPWSIENLAKRLYVPADFVSLLLQQLEQRGLIAVVSGPPEGYRYDSRSIDQDQLLAAVDSLYRREVVRISTMIHSKPSASLREFSRAFRFKKERE